jgi:hypothetical protein
MKKIKFSLVLLIISITTFCQGINSWQIIFTGTNSVVFRGVTPSNYITTSAINAGSSSSQYSFQGFEL